MFTGTTIIGVHDGANLAIGGDGQVTFAEKTILKHNAVKVRRLHSGQVLAGFAGSVADAFALFERFEAKIEQYRGDLPRAAVELAKDWRTDKMLRRLEAMLIVGDRKNLLILSGTGEVIQPEDGIAAIGSGGSYALAAAKALKAHTGMGVAEIARESLHIAASICIYTNEEIKVETL